MKRLVPMLVAALAAAALVAGTGMAGDAKGPPCTNVIGGGDSLGYRYNGDGTGTVEATFILAAPACAQATYTLDVYNLQGTGSPLQTYAPTSVSGDTVTFSYTFSGAPTDGVCLVGTTYHKAHLSDRAPNSGCAPVPEGSSAANSGWN